MFWVRVFSFFFFSYSVWCFSILYNPLGHSVSRFSPKACFVSSIKTSGEHGSEKRNLRGYSFNSFGDAIYFHVLGNLGQTVFSLRSLQIHFEKLFGFIALLD